jgi:hypothetical protein
MHTQRTSVLHARWRGRGLDTDDIQPNITFLPGRIVILVFPPFCAVVNRKSQSKPIYPERCFRVEVEG